MRNQWRLLLHARSLQRISTTQVQHSLRTFSSSSFSSSLPLSRAPHAPSPFLTPFGSRSFSSSELSVDQNSPPPPTPPTPIDQTVTFTDIFSDPNKSNEEIKLNLESNNIIITHDLINSALKSLDSSPEVGKRLFDWVLENDPQKLSSKSYNLMLKLLGLNGFVEEFWVLVRKMKNKGYGIRKLTLEAISNKFEKEGKEDDVKRLKSLFTTGSTDNSVINLCSRVSKVIRQDIWGDETEKKLKELNIEYLNDLVAMVIENIGLENNKGLIFFKWVEESNLCKHDEITYNAIARVLSKEDSAEKFWKIMNEMKNLSYKMEKETFIEVFELFIKKKMMKDAVDLFEYAMNMENDENTPTLQDCTLLLKKIVVSPELDFDLFSRAVKVFKKNGNEFTRETFNSVVKSLISVGRISECNEILKVMEVRESLKYPCFSKIAYHLGKGKKVNEANEFIENIKAEERVYASLIEGYCKAGDLINASETFRKMVKVGPGILDLLINTYCDKNRGRDAYKFVTEISKETINVYHNTYKTLIIKLLAQNFFKEGLNIIGLMKKQGYPPFIDPFLKYLAKKGDSNDAIEFMKVMTVKKYPSNNVYMRVFEAYIEKGRISEAQDILAKCPGYIKNHADVLNMFLLAKTKDSETSETTPALTM